MAGTHTTGPGDGCRYAVASAHYLVDADVGVRGHVSTDLPAAVNHARDVFERRWTAATGVSTSLASDE